MVRRKVLSGDLITPLKRDFANKYNRFASKMKAAVAGGKERRGMDELEIF